MVYTFGRISAIIVILSALFSAGPKAASPGAPTNCRIQDNYEQLGVDTPNPRFAWHFNDADREERQTAYRIIVASSRSALDGGLGDMWDAGKVSSSSQYGVKYAGVALQSATKYWWKVMTWDKDGNQSPWSRPATFVTGFMTPAAWTASWIRAAGNTVSQPYMLRKEFSIGKEIVYATAHICGIGQFELRINGAKVGDHELDPGWTDYKKRQQYVTFEVTSRLKAGSNAIGVWLADGFMDLGNSQGRYTYFNRSDGVKRLLLELVIRYSDGSSERIKSDATWKTATGAISYAHTFGGEDHDGTRDKTGWDNPGYDDASWSAAVITTSPGGSLVSQFQPPIRVVETLTPVSMTQQGTSVRVNC